MEYLLLGLVGACCAYCGWKVGQLAIKAAAYLFGVTEDKIGQWLALAFIFAVIAFIGYHLFIGG